MRTNLKKRNEGFTIIEVMIVLAIAGLIMLIVFLAVPALQRNQRNTSRKNDISRIGAAINEWGSNNRGAVLTAGASNANLTTILQSAGALNEYTLTAAAAVGANSFTITEGPTANVAAMVGGTGNVNLGSVNVVVGATCGANGVATPNTSQRRVVLQHLVESANGVTALCTEV